MSLTKICKLLILAIAAFKTATVSATYTCTAQAANVNFGNFNPLDATPKTLNVVFRITCNNPTNSSLNVSYTGGLSAGNSGNANSRYMKNGTSTLLYNLYYDNGYNQPYPTSGLSDNYTLAANSSAYRDYTVYGKLPAQTSATPKTYTDSLTLSISY